ncbi:hypothetical protein [Leucobacter iarius]
MVDLHPVEPGVRLDHPWMRRSRWGMAWRVWLAVLTATMAGLLLILGPDGGFGGFSGLSGTAAHPLTSIPALAGVIVLAGGPRLRRYSPITQGFLLGLAVAAVFALVALGASAFDSWGALFLVYCPPAFVACAVGLPLAIWSTTRIGSRVCWPVAGVVLLVYAAVSFLNAGGAFDADPFAG